MEILEPKNDKSKNESELLSFNNSNSEILKIIECPICLEYMSSPIFQCLKGHSICGECRNQLKQCPLCEQKFGDTRNYALENFTSCLKYPCENFNKGCQVSSSPRDIEKHKKLCCFSTIPCPTSSYTKCTWSGYKIWDHCVQKHI